MDGKSRDARPSTEYSARTVADALKRAAEEFGIPAARLEYDIVKDSTRSVLGLVRTGEAVIRVYHPRLAAPAGAEKPEVEQAEAGKPAGAEVEPPRAASSLPAAGPQAAAPPDEEEAPPADASGNPPELGKVATDLVAALLDKMGLIAAVEVADRGGVVDPATKQVSPLVLNIVGDDLGMLIGRRGETLRDLQYIARLIVSRRLGAWPNMVVDVEGYRAKRTNALQTLAVRMADQVRKSGQMVALEPMPAGERRIVHMTLSEDPDVYTESTGADEERKVQILPRRK